MMPTLPAGRNNSIIESRQSFRQSGFTLVEILAVLFIMAMMAGAVVMNLPPKPDPIHEQGKSLAGRIERLAQNSLVEHQAMGMRFTENGYSVVRYNLDIWEIIEEFEFSEDNMPVLTLTESAEEIDLDQAEKSQIPVIRFDNTGLGTPFELTLSAGGSKFIIAGTIDGRVTTEAIS